MAIKPKLLGDFTALGKTVEANGEKIRPEVAVSLAAAHVKEIQDGKVARAVLVVEGAKFELNGYLSPQETVLEILRKAQENNEAIVVRFEKKRKKGVDPKAPIADITATMDIARENITKIISGVYNFNTNQWVLTREAESDPSEDPEGTIEAIKACNVDVDAFFRSETPSSGSSAAPQSGNREEESKENALLSMYFFVEEQAIKNGLNLDVESKKKIALSLLKASNFLQVNMFGLEAPIYSAYSHTRARFLVFKWIETISPLDANAAENMPAWGSNLVQNSHKLWQWAREVMNASV